MDIEFRQLRALKAVIEHGSFNRAAAALGVTQPAISKSIDQLERALGTRLFDRDKSGTRVTEAGLIVARTAGNAQNLLAMTREEVRAAARGIAGPLHIGATPSAMAGIVPKACAELARAAGPVGLVVREGLDAALQPALEAGEIAILIGPISDIHAPPAHLNEVLLLEEALRVGMRPGHPLSGAATLRLADLAAFGWVLPHGPSRFHQLVEAMFLHAATSWPRDVIHTNALAAQEQIAMETDRLVLLSEVQLVGRQTALATVPLAGSPLRRFGWRTLAAAAPPPLLSRFTAILADIARAG